MKKKISIVDDHVLIAQALKGIVENFENFEVIHVCENGSVLQDKLKFSNLIPDIVLLDISMPVLDGFDTALWLKENHPSVLILTLSMQNDEQSVIKMLKNGAHGYMLKNSNPNDLCTALNKLLTDGFYYPDWASKIMFNNINATNKNDKYTIQISEREKEFLSYCVTEMTYKDIAQKMFCSPRTVEGYRDSLFEKLDLKTRVGLAIYAIKNGYE